MPANTIALLKKWKVQQSEKRLKVGDLWHKKNEISEDENWVFTTWDGRPMHPDTPSKWFNKFLKDNKLPHIPFHGLRHTSATLLIAEGSDIREVSGRLGHSNTSTTGDIYAHFLKKADQAAAEKLNNLMGRRKKQDGKANSGK